MSRIFFEKPKTPPLYAKYNDLDQKQINYEHSNFPKYKSVPQNIIENIDSVNSKYFQKYLSEKKPDLGIVFGTGLIRKETINYFKDGLVNVHRGIATEYRGLDSDLWAIYHTDYENIGVTIHMVETKLDTGDIIYTKKLNLNREMNTTSLRYHTTILSTDLIIKTVNTYLNDNLECYPQQKTGRYYSHMPYDLKLLSEKKINEYCKKL